MLNRTIKQTKEEIKYPFHCGSSKCAWIICRNRANDLNVRLRAGLDSTD
jgi:hypothetical protein